MKLLSTLLLCSVIAGPLLAQPHFKLTASAPTREYTEGFACGTNQYIVKQTERRELYRDKGTLLLYSADHQLKASLPYEYPLKRVNQLTYPLFVGNKLYVFSGNSSGYQFRLANKHIMAFNTADIKIQEHDPFNLKPVGSQKILLPRDSKFSSAIIAKSDDGNYVALIQNPIPDITVTVYKNGELVFTKELTLQHIPSKNTSTHPVYNSITVSNRGDVAFAYGDWYSEWLYTGLVAISAEGKHILDKKIEISNESLPADPYLLFEEDGSLLAAVSCARQKKFYLRTGIYIEKFSPKLELITRVELPFSQESIAKCQTKDDLDLQLVQNILPVTDGYVVVTQRISQTQSNETAFSATTNPMLKTSYNNLLCFGLSKDLKENYQEVIRYVPYSQQFMLYQQVGSYGSGKRVYMFHPGVDDKMKNTPNEFDLYCTTWEGATNPPQTKTVTLTRPYPELHIYPETYEILGPNKLLFYARKGTEDVRVTMEITE